MAQQIIASLKIISGEDGTDLGMLCVTDYLLHFDFTLLLCVSTGRKRIAQLADNAKFFRQAMKRMGFIIFGVLCYVCMFSTPSVCEFSQETTPHLLYR